MITQQKPGEVAQVPCEVCMTEIPKSAASVFEAADYVHHFCGLDCYATWKAQKDRSAFESQWDTLP
jgi:hypothetical protein